LDALSPSDKQERAIESINDQLTQARIQLAMPNVISTGTMEGDLICHHINGFPHSFWQLRQHCGGRYEDFQTDDEVARVLARLVPGVFPALLITAFRRRYGAADTGLGSGHVNLYRRPEQDEFSRAFVEDAVLRSILAAPDEEISEEIDMRGSLMIHSSAGQGGSFQLCTFPDLIIKNAFRLAQCRQHTTVTDVQSAVAELIGIARLAIQEGNAKVPAFVGLNGVGFEDPLPVNVKGGALNQIGHDLMYLIPSGARPSSTDGNVYGLVYETEVPFRIVTTPLNDRSGAEPFESLRPLMAEQAEAINRLVLRVSTAVALSIDQNPPVGVSFGWVATVDPFSYPSFSWNDSRSRMQRRYRLNEQERLEFPEWARRVCKMPRRDEIALRRIHSANERWVANISQPEAQARQCVRSSLTLRVSMTLSPFCRRLFCFGVERRRRELFGRMRTIAGGERILVGRRSLFSRIQTVCSAKRHTASYQTRHSPL